MILCCTATRIAYVIDCLGLYCEHKGGERYSFFKDFRVLPSKPVSGIEREMTSSECTYVRLIESCHVVDLRATMEALFKHLGVQRWEDMIVFSVKDIVDEINVASEPGPLKSKLLQKRLGYIVEYAKHAALDNSTMMNAIVHTVQTASATPTDVGDTKMRVHRAQPSIRRLYQPWTYYQARMRITSPFSIQL